MSHYGSDCIVGGHITGHTGEHGERVSERRELLADVDVQVRVHALHLPRHVQEPLRVLCTQMLFISYIVLMPLICGNLEEPMQSIYFQINNYGGHTQRKW